MLDARSAIMRCVVDDVGTEAHGHDANGRFSQDTFPGLNRQEMFQRISVVRGPDVSISSGPAARKRHLSNARDAYTKGQSIEVVRLEHQGRFRRPALLRATTFGTFVCENSAL